MKMQNLNLNKNLAAQDMIRIIMREKGLTAKESVEFAVNNDMYQKIISEGYASIAFDLWGHADFERKWDVLENPILNIDFSQSQEQLINAVSEKESVDFETAICYFLIFTMDFLGYHI